MTIIENLLTVLMEECAEVAHRAAKIQRFGAGDIQAGQEQTCAQRLQQEFGDLLGVYELLEDKGVLVWPTTAQTMAKKEKVWRYLELSRRRGLVTI